MKLGLVLLAVLLSFAAINGARAQHKGQSHVKLQELNPPSGSFYLEGTPVGLSCMNEQIHGPAGKTNETHCYVLLVEE